MCLTGVAQEAYGCTGAGVPMSGTHMMSYLLISVNIGTKAPIKFYHANHLPILKIEGLRAIVG